MGASVQVRTRMGPRLCRENATEGFFVKRFFFSFALIVSTAMAAHAQTPGAPPTTPTAPNPDTCRDVAIFNMAKVQKEFKKWDVYTKDLQTLRTNEAKRLAELQAQIADIKKKLENPAEPQRDLLEKQGVALTRTLQDMDIEVRKKIDKASTDYLGVLHDDIRRVVEAVARANQFGIVMAYPDATTVEESKSPVYFDMKLRPAGAMPYYVNKACDMTDTIIKTLNQFCPPPAGIVPAGATAPAAGSSAAPATGRP
jgi:Skp family chaperone for outer membrane proteins